MGREVASLDRMLLFKKFQSLWINNTEVQVFTPKATWGHISSDSFSEAKCLPNSFIYSFIHLKCKYF